MYRRLSPVSLNSLSPVSLTRFRSVSRRAACPRFLSLREESESYFQSRPRGSQLGAMTSHLHGLSHVSNWNRSAPNWKPNLQTSRFSVRSSLQAAKGFNLSYNNHGVYKSLKIEMNGAISEKLTTPSSLISASS